MRRGMSLVCLLVTTISCGTLGMTDVVRARHARQFNCLQDSVRVIEQEDGSLRAWGCGPDTTYVCRGDHRCSPQSRAVVRLTGGGDSGGSDHQQSGTTASWSGSRPASGSGSTTSRPPPPVLSTGPRDAGPPPPRGAQAGPPGGATTTPSDAVRALLEQRRSDVLVCTGRSTVGVRATYSADGSLDLALQGELHGSPEEDCVRNALRELRIAPPQHSGVVVHLIR